MNQLPADIQKDIETISNIAAVTRILDVVTRTTGLGFAAVARVTDTRWVACAVKDNLEFGLTAGSELRLESTICHEIEKKREAVVIDNAEEDEDYSRHQTPLLYGFQSYISVPIVLKNGMFFGTLCALDPKPNNLKDSSTLEMFTLFADLISYYIYASEELTTVQISLTEERKTAELREQFIAVLGHDLRNPVNAISNSAQVLTEMQLEIPAKSFLNIIRNSTYRINGLIENMLDFARGRLGGGMSVNYEENVDIKEVLNGIVAELQVAFPRREIITDFYLSEPLRCDSKQVAQLFSNLLNNALTYGKPSAPVMCKAISNGKGFSLLVCNEGTPIATDVMARIFQPFYRGEKQHTKQGLGLGLYIASEIARAHGGTLSVSSTEQNTCFVFQIGH